MVSFGVHIGIMYAENVDKSIASIEFVAAELVKHKRTQ